MQCGAPRKILSTTNLGLTHLLKSSANMTSGRRSVQDALVQQINVLGTKLMPCSFDPMTGFYRTGCCEHRGDDPGMHTVCARVTANFLAFSASLGNDLTTPMPQYGFAGLTPGDQWCVCAMRWKEAFEAGQACGVILESTHVSTLEYVDLADLQKHAVTTDGS